jgi:hypothetical protein
LPEIFIRGFYAEIHYFFPSVKKPIWCFFNGLLDAPVYDNRQAI